LVLGAVIDRGQIYNPPTFLHGEELFQVSPLDLAEDAIVKVRQMIEEAAGFLR
jgi:hypothetical protein